ncbi:hypothetical protein RHSIM_Rhsim11G0132700 [Rhododendron simsii]|uniref:Uncharacterized protein n=1 Tax=Rhododendron simsii TaxID=118357 RepID=A0A834G6W5_RHOSS|nr:hypothetical protein RHSIM_Rhsim11G0132700 [Rhododendron simsii]
MGRRGPHKNPPPSLSGEIVFALMLLPHSLCPLYKASSALPSIWFSFSRVRISKISPMEGSSLTNEEIEAALQLIQLISSGSRRCDATIGKFKLEEGEDEREDGSTAAAYASSPSPSSIEKIVQRKNGSFGERKRKLLLSSTGAQIRRGIVQNEMKAAEQLLNLSEEEGEGGGRQESGSNISEASYVTDASSAVAMETRADQERESEAKQGGGGGGGGRSNSNRRGLASFYTEEGERDFMEEESCLADFLCRRRKRKFRSLIDIYTITNPLNGSRD